MDRGFTEYERRALTRSLEKRGQMKEWQIIVILVLSFAFVLAYAADNDFHLTAIAHAETETHQNAYYCKQIAITGESVVGISHKDLMKLCK